MLLGQMFERVGSYYQEEIMYCVDGATLPFRQHST